MGWTYHQLATNHQTETFELRYAVFKHIFVDLLLFWLLPWGKHLLQVYPGKKRCFKRGEQFLALSPMPAGPRKWIKSFRTQLFVVQKCYFSACVRFPQKTFHTADGGRDAKKPYRFGPHSMALISWLLRWGVVLVTVATECDEGVSMGSWGKRVGFGVCLNQCCIHTLVS